VRVEQTAFVRQLDELLRWRRDVRRFREKAVPEALVDDVLGAVRFAPSVGLSEPTRLIKVMTADKRVAIEENFERCNGRALAGYEDDKAQLYADLKLEGLREAPVHIAVFCDEETGQGHGLGRQTMPETLVYSVVSGVTLMWLAAEARELGMGWVSILDPAEVARTLDVPNAWRFVGYLCLGWPVERHDVPELERMGWERRGQHGLHVEVR